MCVCWKVFPFFLLLVRLFAFLFEVILIFFVSRLHLGMFLSLAQKVSSLYLLLLLLLQLTITIHKFSCILEFLMRELKSHYHTEISIYTLVLVICCMASSVSELNMYWYRFSRFIWHRSMLDCKYLFLCFSVCFSVCLFAQLDDCCFCLFNI